MAAPSQLQTGLVKGLSGLASGFDKGYEREQGRQEAMDQKKMIQNSLDARKQLDIDNSSVPSEIFDKKRLAEIGVSFPEKSRINNTLAQSLAAQLQAKYRTDNPPPKKGDGAGGVKLSPKDQDAIQRITQGLNNLKQVEQMYTSTNAGSHGLAGALSQVPGLGRMMKSNPQFQNANPEFTNYDRSVEEAKNAYSRATFGRVSNEILAHSRELFPSAGSDKGIARTSLNELSNTLQGVANGLVAEKRAAGDEKSAQALEQHFQGLFGNMRFFPEMDEGATRAPAAPGSAVRTTYVNPPAAPAAGGGDDRLSQIDALVQAHRAAKGK